ncbi:MAG: TetR/AcrR family transcriptional regulator [Actinomycetaceae bacterium]|nr:TetR/AcrR family transcriptional regulator [Actinomycetaceae bacterium]
MKRPRLGRKTGPKPQFSVSEIAECALQLGLDRFTMGQLARELGIVPSAIYRYVESREDLIMQALARAGRLLRPPAPGATWQDVLRTMTDDMWNMFESYPRLAVALSQTPGAHVHIQKYMRAVVDALVDGGIPGGRERALFAFDFVGDTVMGQRIFIDEMVELSEDGTSGLDRARQRFEESPYAPVGEDVMYYPAAEWVSRQPLDRKVEFIISALELVPFSQGDNHTKKR